MHHVLRVCLLMGSHPVGNQGALAGAGFPGNENLLLACLNPVLQLLGVPLTAEIDPLPRLAVAGVLTGLPLEGIGLIEIRIQLLDQDPEVCLGEGVLLVCVRQ